MNVEHITFIITSLCQRLKFYSNLGADLLSVGAGDEAAMRREKVHSFLHSFFILHIVFHVTCYRFMHDLQRDV